MTSLAPVDLGVREKRRPAEPEVIDRRKGPELGPPERSVYGLSEQVPPAVGLLVDRATKCEKEEGS